MTVEVFNPELYTAINRWHQPEDADDVARRSIEHVKREYAKLK